jgi:hypothetical protein
MGNKGTSKKAVLISGSILVLILLTLGITYFWLRNNPQCSDRSQDQGWECIGISQKVKMKSTGQSVKRVMVSTIV